MIKRINIDKWSREPQYYLFKTYENPFFNISANVDVTNLVNYCKNNTESFFLNLLFIGAKVNNEIEEFRLRIRGEDVVIHDEINFGTPVMHKDKTFIFCYFKYLEDRSTFIKHAKTSLDKEKGNPSFNPRHDEDEIIHLSVLPWINFTSIKHTRRIPVTDSVPKIVYGKYIRMEDKFVMPISLEVHHALLDGYHAGLFYEKWEQIELSLK